MALDYTAPLDPVRRWDSATATCLNVASTGEVIHPQSKIVSALAELVVDDWTFRWASLSLLLCC